MMVQFIITNKSEGLEISNNSNIYAWTASTLFWLKPRQLIDQIKDFLKIKQFDLALNVAGSDENLTDRCNMIKAIEFMHARSLFNEKRYKESMALFSRLNIDPIKVIHLFPNLLPVEFDTLTQNVLTIKDPVDKDPLYDIVEAGQRGFSNSFLDSSILEEDFDYHSALLALTEYLTEKRIEYLLKINQDTSLIKKDSSSDKILSSREYMKIIDTCLLKCYSKTNDALIGPLLRLPTNYCDAKICEKILRKRNKLEELVILYQKEKNHKKALVILGGMVDKETDDEEIQLALDKMLGYLQHLGSQYSDLIFEYSQRLFKQDPSNALKVFTEDMPEVRSLNREAVLYYLIKYSPDSIIPYLEHIIYNWDDQTTSFHNALINQYREKISLEIESVKSSLKAIDLNPNQEDTLSLIDADSDDKLIKNFVEPVGEDENDLINNPEAGEDEEKAQDAKVLLEPPPNKNTIFDLIKSGDGRKLPEDVLCSKINSLYVRYLHLKPDDSLISSQHHTESIPLEYYEIRLKSMKKIATIKQTRKKLRKLLDTSTHYIPETLINTFPFDDFVFEKALLYGRLGQHKTALAIYACLLRDVKLALTHCAKYYFHHTNFKDIYFQLFELLVDPSILKDIDTPELKFDENVLRDKSLLNLLYQCSLQILRDYGDRMPVLQVLNKIDNDMPLTDVYDFITHSYVSLQEKLNNERIMEALLIYKDSKIENTKYNLLNRKICLTEDTVCKLCEKKISNSAFVFYPDSVSYAHYHCYNEN